ncbi:hypothetical protein [Haloactinopolyspora alba]|uniref:hypothetical protein n=1 Tax=Haloactinopolyspora alba TaxID=648780 RepID=UPI00101D0942|nr:hypothetical protein [Haloactinopolyspora alba]
MPAGDGRISLVSREDAGRCLAILATSAPTGLHHDITGPAALSMDAVADVVTRTSPEPVRYVDVEPRTHVAELANSGADAWWTQAFSTMFASVREQRWDTVSDEVRRITGTAPLSLADVLDSSARV